MTAPFPSLSEPWEPTRRSMHLWSQVAGKIRMALTPPVNHWWHVTLQVTSRGLTTGAMPLPDGRSVEIAFDYINHELTVVCSDGATRRFALRAQSVASFHAKLMGALQDLGVGVWINTLPAEIPDPVRFEEDDRPGGYDPDAANRCWRAFCRSAAVMGAFRGRFLGKASPVHLFWGAFDLAVTRFSGRRAPDHPPAPGLPLAAVREAYSHEVCSFGFWPGDGENAAMFYAYAYPQPAGFEQAGVSPGAAAWNPALGEFVLPYEAVRTAAQPEATLMNFFQTTYDAAATLAEWDRRNLER